MSSIVMWLVLKGETFSSVSSLEGEKLILKFSSTFLHLLILLIIYYLFTYSLFRVIKRLDQYDEFYLAFKSVISDLMEILGNLYYMHTKFSVLFSQYASLKLCVLLYYHNWCLKFYSLE